MRSNHEKFMRMAIGRAEAGDAPYGAVMVQNGIVVASSFNTVKADRDPTAHAEIKLVRATVRELGLTNLETCTMYSTVEPCPMCMGAAMLAGVGTVVYGASIQEVKAYRPQIELSCREVAARGFRKIEVIGGVLGDLCVAPFGLGK
ncbi:MAG: nucleoside deaminase [Candidatus Sumerlaeaceae bacterium]